MWFKKDLVAEERLSHVPGVPMSRRRVLGAMASVLALYGAKGVTVATSTPADAPTVTGNGDHYVLVDGWVIPVRYLRG